MIRTEAHLVVLQFAESHRESPNESVASRRVEVGDAKVSAQSERQVEADVDEEKDGKEFGRVGESATKREHVETEHAQLLNEKREDDEREEDGTRAQVELDVEIAGQNGRQCNDVRDDLG